MTSLSFEDNAPPTSAQTVLTSEFDQCIWGADAREVWRALAAAGPVVRPNPGIAVVTSTAGVEQVLHMQDEIARMQRRLERFEREMRNAIKEVERQYKRELVVWKPPTELTPRRR